MGAVVKEYGYTPCTCTGTLCSCRCGVRVTVVKIEEPKDRETIDHLDRLMKSTRVKDWEQRLPRRRR